MTVIADQATHPSVMVKLPLRAVIARDGTLDGLFQIAGRVSSVYDRGQESLISVSKRLPALNRLAPASAGAPAQNLSHAHDHGHASREAAAACRLAGVLQHFLGYPCCLALPYAMLLVSCLCP